MRGVVVLAFALAASSAQAQDATVKYYYSPEPRDLCSLDPGSPCSIIECGLGWRCACPLTLPNGWKRPLTKEQCEAARRKFPLYPAEEVRRHHGYEQKKTEASASGTPKGRDRPVDPKDFVSPRSEAARKIPDDQLCEPLESGGGGIWGSPTTCKYRCGTVLVCVELTPPEKACPGDQSGMSKAPWKNVKGLGPCKPKS